MFNESFVAVVPFTPTRPIPSRPPLKNVTVEHRHFVNFIAAQNFKHPLIRPAHIVKIN